MLNIRIKKVERLLILENKGFISLLIHELNEVFDKNDVPAQLFQGQYSEWKEKSQLAEAEIERQKRMIYPKPPLKLVSAKIEDEGSFLNNIVIT